MSKLTAWWAGLPKTQRLMIGVGVPLTAVAAIYSLAKGNKKPEARKSQDNPQGDDPASNPGTFLGAPTYSNQGAAFDILQILGELRSNPATPVGVVQPVTMAQTSTDDLVEQCKAQNGPTNIVAEMWRRGFSFNDPRIGGTQCGEEYARYGLAHGAIPTPMWD